MALLVTPNHLQLSVQPAVENQRDFIVSKIGRMVDPIV
jgi:hypothetical protein